MASEPQSDGASLERLRTRIAGTWQEPDPKVLAFAGDGLPVVVDVRGELRYLDYHRIESTPIDQAVLCELAAERGNPHVIRLSEHPAGYRKALFRRTTI